MTITVRHCSTTPMQLQKEVLYGVPDAGVHWRGRSATQKVWYTAPTVIAAARVEVREAFG